MGASGHQMSRAACRKPPATRLLLWHGATPTTRRRWASGAAYLPRICLCIKARAHAPSTRYIVCATGKTAEEMLGILQERLRTRRTRSSQMALPSRTKSHICASISSWQNSGSRQVCRGRGRTGRRQNRACCEFSYLQTCKRVYQGTERRGRVGDIRRPCEPTSKRTSGILLDNAGTRQLNPKWCLCQGGWRGDAGAHEHRCWRMRGRIARADRCGGMYQERSRLSSD